MAKLRPARCCREPKKRAYTRKSKYQKKSYVKGIPGSKIVLFDMGNKSGCDKYEYRVSLISQELKQIRHNSIESARMACVRRLNRLLGANNYYFKIKVFPHSIIREKPIAAGAGADRYSSGMKLSFGKATSTAAIVKPGQEIMYVGVNKQGAEKAKEALKKASDKIGCKFKIEIREENVGI